MQEALLLFWHHCRSPVPELASSHCHFILSTSSQPPNRHSLLLCTAPKRDVILEDKRTLQPYTIVQPHSHNSQLHNCSETSVWGRDANSFEPSAFDTAAQQLLERLVCSNQGTVCVMSGIVHTPQETYESLHTILSDEPTLQKVSLRADSVGG